ncbi:thioredoxin-like negative regulator of GroEL [Litorivivens lipolytica]|uniref:Thioredoxin-like negative regulator of GroEL n=1 Tax=Litorivivens lipolytica TaxID=1524264 RepID=A0A7W4W6A8_9GAMM|nr:hypothetical protein [Litorivivens lipolytica]MBB3048281.1 thioredoxin-like negative regulator of GroEL [Litorivivens lipolytica]
MKAVLRLDTAGALALAVFICAAFGAAPGSAFGNVAPEVRLPEGSDIVWRRTLHNAPPNRDLLTKVKRLIEHSREQGDLRALGQAEALLAKPTESTTEIAVLKAVIAQRKHAFSEATVMLKQVLAQAPRHPQANFTLHNVALVQGNYALALSTCNRLGEIGYRLIQASCHYNLIGLEGQPEKAFTGLQSILQNPPAHSELESAWAMGTLAELAAAINHPETERYYSATLALSPKDHYSAAGLADWHLRQGAPDKALTVLSGRPSTDRLDLLRLIALRQSKRPGSEPLQRELQQRFERASQRDETLHLYERARFLLDVENNPRAALELAERNFAIQKERADLQLLQRARRTLEQMP